MACSDRPLPGFGRHNDSCNHCPFFRLSVKQTSTILGWRKCMERVVPLWNDNRVDSNDLPLPDDKMPALQTQMVLACNSKGPQAQYRD